MNIKEQYEAAQRKLDALQSARRNFTRKAEDEASRKIEAEAESQFGTDIQSAIEEFAAAKTAWLAEKESEAAKSAPHPIGTKYLRWEKEQRRWSAPPDKQLKWIATGETALLEVVTRESKFADNLASYSVPRMGSLILRIHRKDGKLGLRFVKSYNFSPEWYPEGEDPNQAEESARKAKEKQKAEEWMKNPTLCVLPK